MKIFEKIKSPNGRRRCYFCGIKVCSYKRKKTIEQQLNRVLEELNKIKKETKSIQREQEREQESKLIIDIPIQIKSDLLFYTYANKKYFSFAVLYPIFVLNSNPNSIVEIALDDYDLFLCKYKHIQAFYEEKYPGQVFYHPIKRKKEFEKLIPNSLRFITQPLWKAKYVYIGDVDILILEDILNKHINNIKENQLDYSNIVRKGTTRLTGLHFIEYNKMYPIELPNQIRENDEEMLYDMMLLKGYTMPNENITYRPIHGLHVSWHSRPPFATLTTKDRNVSFPSWFGTCQEAAAYLRVRYTNVILDFMATIRETDVELRRVIQVVDAVCFYHVHFEREDYII